MLLIENVDFNAIDEQDRVRLNTRGVQRWIEEHKLDLDAGAEVLLTDGEICCEGVLQVEQANTPAGHRWLAALRRDTFCDYDAVVHVPGDVRGIEQFCARCGEVIDHVGFLSNADGAHTSVGWKQGEPVVVMRYCRSMNLKRMWVRGMQTDGRPISKLEALVPQRECAAAPS